MATKTQKSRKGQTVKLSNKKGKIKEDKDITEPKTDFQKPQTSATIGGSNIELSKIKLREDMFLTITFIESYEGDKVRNPTNKELNWPVHDDLKAAFKTFIPHFAIISGYQDERKTKDINAHMEKLAESFKVIQVSLSSNTDGVTITGNHTVKKKKKVNFNAPYTKFYEAGDDGYKFGTDLQMAWDELVRETIEYINGKHGTPVQTEMNFEGDKEPADDLPFAEEEL